MGIAFSFGGLGVVIVGGLGVDWPHHLPHYSLDLASVFHSFYKQCKVVSDAEDLTKARLKLVVAAQVTLRNTLDLIGVSAPDQMFREELAV